MIEAILECLSYNIESDSEYVQIARGKNKLPETFKEGYQQIKNELCHRKQK